MKRFISPATLALVLLASLGFARSAAAKDQVLLKGTFDGTSVQTPDGASIHDEITAAGNASHLGNFDMVVSATVNPVTRTGEGTLVLVAANGDTLTATFTGSSQLTPTPGVVLITENATVTGGTGRFDNATGSFTIERLFNRFTHEVTGTITGTISSPGANKH